jgi:acetyl-CoA carboxylase biotin carboxylase subunit
MFKRILIANRGEIALRIIWACKELGIETVAVYSTADISSLHVHFADRRVCIGGPKSDESYLNIPAVISAAEITGAEAIHPGYGFLAENAHFAEICGECKIKFIGPTPESIRMMGNKSEARKLMAKRNVPIIPGSRDIIKTPDEAEDIANQIGYPVMLKASAGGGGRGMRIARNNEEVRKEYETARTEAEASFGVPDLYIEKHIEQPRHIEVQILADEHGNMIHLGERECSIQRRHQKLIEESPSPVVGKDLRKAMTDVALKAARTVDYHNAGTIEFLLDKNMNFYFMEMNTRIQVEHPVTEWVTGVDIVKEQIKIANGQKLSFKQDDIQFRGHSIECRVNAETPDTFMPSPGRITAFNTPKGPGVRVDTAMYEGAEIPPYYDSMIAKVAVYGRDRDEAINRMRRALDMMVLEGIHSNIPMHLKILEDADFKKGNLSTHFMERYMPIKNH